MQTDKLVTAGERDLLLTCGARGQPAPNITWFKDYEQLQSNEHFEISQSQDVQACEGHERCSLKVTLVLKKLCSV